MRALRRRGVEDEDAKANHGTSPKKSDTPSMPSVRSHVCDVDEVSLALLADVVPPPAAIDAAPDDKSNPRPSMLDVVLHRASDDGAPAAAGATSVVTRAVPWTMRKHRSPSNVAEYGAVIWEERHRVARLYQIEKGVVRS